MLACTNCGALTYDRVTCINCGDGTEAIVTVESIIISELIKIIIDSKLFIRYGVVWSHNNPNDSNTMQIRLWAAYPFGWEGGRYIGHIEVDDDIICVSVRCQRGELKSNTEFKIPLADPLCFEHFREVITWMKNEGANI